jgi:rubrerythrin
MTVFRAALPVPTTTEWGTRAPARVTEGRVPATRANHALSEFRCHGCGYGARARMAPDRCPMCSSTVWDYVPRRRAAEEEDALWPLTRDTG